MVAEPQVIVVSTKTDVADIFPSGYDLTAVRSVSPADAIRTIQESRAVGAPTVSVIDGRTVTLPPLLNELAVRCNDVPVVVASSAASLMSSLPSRTLARPAGSLQLAQLVQQLLSGATQRMRVRTTLDQFNVRLQSGVEPVADERQRRRLQLSDLYLSNILGQAHDAMVITDRGGVVVLWNTGAERLFGIAQPDAVGRRVDQVAADPALAQLQDAITSLSATARTRALSVTRSSPRGEQHLELSLSLIDQNGAGVAVSVIARDVTERNALVNQLRTQADALRASNLAVAAARDTAEAANRVKDEFLAMLGHELRNPLSPIVTALEVMKLRGDGSQQPEHAIIARQVKHLTRLVDDLLDVSRITSGKVELKFEVVELREVVGRAVEMASPLLEQHSHTLTLDVASVGLALAADPGRLSQVVSNLVINAAKYTPKGGRITLRAARTDRHVELRVSDNGVGIPAAALGTVFDLFVQGRRTLDRGEGGLGLGLAIARTLVEQHGGSISAHSDGPGRGSEFVVTLPAAVLPAPTLAADEGRPPTPTPSNGKRILVVDDNWDAAEMLAAALRLRGYHVAVAHDGPEALVLAGNTPFDAGFIDIGLPVMDGYELVKQLKRLPGCNTLRLIAVTGYGQESDRRRAIEAGFDHHLVKPVDVPTIEQWISA